MDNTLYVEYDSTDTVATDFIQRITLEMERLGIFKIRNKPSQKRKPIVEKKDNPVLDKLLVDFENIKKEYPDNWDYEGAIAITKSVSDNYKAVLEAGYDLISGKWWISPESNGTLVMISNSANSNIQIGDSTISYFVEHSNNESEGESSIKFSVEKVLEVIKKANEYGDNSK